VLDIGANDGTVTKLGWKAQNKSLLMFSGEAYNVEMGATNELFRNERSAAAGCVYNGTPEDATNLTNPTGGSTAGTASEMSADIITPQLLPRELQSGRRVGNNRPLN
jgi:CxxC motif-containing protein (DUF1111 family)